MKKVNEKEAKQQTESISITKVLRENHTWVLASITLLGVFLSGLFRFIDFTKSKIYFSYYGLSLEFYQYSRKGILYESVYSALLLIAMYVAVICFREIIAGPRNNRSFWSYLYVCSCSNLLITFGVTSTISIINLFANFILLVFVEFLLFCFFNWIKKKSDLELSDVDNAVYSKRELIKEFIFICFALFCSVIFVFNATQFFDIKFQREYKILEKNQVIIYTTDDYYITLDCEINDDSLIINKGTETKISTDNVHSELKKFNNVQIKNES